MVSEVNGKNWKKRGMGGMGVCYPTITPFPTITHVENENLMLSEDYFDSFYGPCGKRCCIRRFTWKNHNNIQVQLINYGARITSIKVPNLDGTVHDIVVGFDDIKGYHYYGEDKIGATLGRMCSKIRSGFFSIKDKFFCVSHLQKDGNKFDFDNTIWKSYVEDSKVILSFIFKEVDQYYPGDLLVQMTYELSNKNEFKINIEAFTTKETPVDISNNIYFNLCGHGSGPEHLEKHVLRVNANSFTPNKFDGLPDGTIQTVMNSYYDFQVPKKLRNFIHLNRHTNQNLCVNDTKESEKFVASIWHPTSGRMTEIYSNQPGVNLSILNELKSRVNNENNKKQFKLFEATDSDCKLKNDLVALATIYDQMVAAEIFTEEIDYGEIKNAFKSIRKELVIMYAPTPANTPDEYSYSELSQPIKLSYSYFDSTFSQKQQKYLQTMHNFIGTIQSDIDYTRIQEAIRITLRKSKIIKQLKSSTENLQESSEFLASYILDNAEEELTEEQTIHDVVSDVKEEIEETPPLGKNNVVYSKNGAICLRTQNYPNAVNQSEFPKCILKPGEKYKHTIVYKFWLKSSNAKKYWKENSSDKKSICKEGQKISKTKRD